MDLSRWGGRGTYSFLVYGGIIFITGSGLTVRRATHVQLLFCGVILKIVFANTPDIKRVTTRLFLLACASNVSTWNCDEITQKHRRYRSTNLLYSCRAIETKTTRGKKEKKKEKKREEEKLITKKYFSKFEIEKSREIYGQEQTVRESSTSGYRVAKSTGTIKRKEENGSTKAGGKTGSRLIKENRRKEPSLV